MGNVKNVLFRIFNEQGTPGYRLVYGVLAFATITSLLTAILRGIPTLTAYTIFFEIVDGAIVFLFGCEYLLRLWSAKQRAAYAKSFYGIVDLASILPSLLSVGNLTFLKSVRLVRLLRTTRYLRLFGISRFTHQSNRETREILGVYGRNLFLFTLALAAYILVLGMILAFFEEAPAWNIVSGTYWTFLVFIGFHADSIPPGVVGTTIFVFAKFSGMIVLGLLVGIFGKIFTELFHSTR